MRLLTAIAGAVWIAAAEPCAGAGAGDGAWDVAGHVAVEARVFPRSPAFDEQHRSTFSPSLGIEPEILYEWNQGLDRFTFVPFLRLDWHDEHRSHFDVRELNWIHQADTWSLLVGIGKVFWGVTESRHLVDVVNQTDLVEDVDEEDKLGQPMINLTLERSWGAIDAFVLPLARERTFPDRDARLRGPVPISGTPGFFSIDGDPSYESGLDQWYPGLAIRYSHAFGEFDLGLAHFHGTSREPRFLPEPTTDGFALRPRYDVIDQSSLDLQWTHDAWLWKLEAIGRRGHGRYFVAAVAGFEYSLYQVLDTAADLGLLLEYSCDGRSDDAAAAPPTRLERDVFAGTRLAWNDVQSTELLAGATVDVQTAETSALLEAGRRLGPRWLVEIEARWLFNTDPNRFAYAFRRDGFLALRLSRFF